MLERLAEPDPRIDAELVALEPAGSRRRDALAQEAPHLGDDVVVRGVAPASSSARPSCASAPCRRRSRRPPRTSPGRRRPTMSFTMDAPASSAARATSALRVSTLTRGRRALGDEPLDHGHHAVRSPPRRGPARRPAGSTRPRRRGCRRRRRPAAARASRRRPRWRSEPAVGERVGRDVDDPHDQGALMQRDRVRPASPDRLVRHGRIVVRCTASRPHGRALTASACRCGSWPLGACARRCGTAPAPPRSRSPSPAS